MAYRQYWFAPKKHGYDAGLPIAWQEWLVLIVFVVSVFLFSLYCSGLYRIAGIFRSAVIVCIIAFYKTKDGWKWR